MYWYGYDSTYFIVLFATILVSGFAQFFVSSTFRKYSKIGTSKSITGAQAAHQVVQYGGAGHIGIQQISGNLTDNFDPRTNVISLSEQVYNSASISAVGVAAHEAGHAVQHSIGYFPNKIRSAMVPITQIGTQISFPLILVGALLVNQTDWVLIAGIAMYSLSFLFQVITLPVEFNASHRAIKILNETGILYPDELEGAKKVLAAAAFTYLAAAFTSLLWLLRIIWVFFGNRERN